MFISIIPLFSLTCCALTIFDQSIVEWINPDGVNMCLLRDGNWLFGLEGQWVLICLDSSVVELLTSDAGVPGLNSRPAIHFYLFSFYISYANLIVYVHSFFSYNLFFLILLQILTIFRIHAWSCNIFDTMYSLLYL